MKNPLSARKGRGNRLRRLSIDVGLDASINKHGNHHSQTSRCRAEQHMGAKGCAVLLHHHDVANVALSEDAVVG